MARLWHIAKEYHNAKSLIHIHCKNKLRSKSNRQPGNQMYMQPNSASQHQTKPCLLCKIAIKYLACLAHLRDIHLLPGHQDH
jgi:hypothetical protein